MDFDVRSKISMKHSLTEEEFSACMAIRRKPTRGERLWVVGAYCLFFVPLSLGAIFIPDTVFESKLALLALLIWVIFVGVSSLYIIWRVAEHSTIRAGLSCPSCGGSLYVHTSNRGCCRKCGHSALAKKETEQDAAGNPLPVE